MPTKKFVLEITPQTHVRTTQGDRILFRIPRTKLRKTSLSRLLRIEKYNNYKIAVSALAKQKKFVMPSLGASIKFYIPVPASWRQWKKDHMHMKPHMQRCDLDNLCKGFFDSLMKEDKHIAHFEAAKFWVNAPEGRIEIVLSDKEDVLV